MRVSGRQNGLHKHTHESHLKLSGGATDRRLSVRPGREPDLIEISRDIRLSDRSALPGPRIRCGLDKSPKTIRERFPAAPVCGVGQSNIEILNGKLKHERKEGWNHCQADIF
jgi:hypothetical protein